MSRRIFFTLFIVLVNLSAKAQNSNFTEIVQYAVKAPSGHNTQPWKFRIKNDSIEILPDFDLTLTAVDNTRREMYISLGCATENLCIAATHFGYEYHIVKSNGQSVIVQLKKSSTGEDPLFNVIAQRQTNRSVYQKRKIAADTLQLIQQVPLEPNVGMYFFENGSSLADTLTTFIARGNTIQMTDKAFKEELLNWIRFNKKQIRQTNNGLTFQTLGFPSLPGFMARVIINSHLKPAQQNKSDLEKVYSSSHLILFTTQHNTPEEWIALGRSLERFLLKTTALGIANGYMNQPCEVTALANELQRTLPVNNEFPTLLLRIGYAPVQPYAPRKNTAQFILQ